MHAVSESEGEMIAQAVADRARAQDELRRLPRPMGPWKQVFGLATGACVGYSWTLRPQQHLEWMGVMAGVAFYMAIYAQAEAHNARRAVDAWLKWARADDTIRSMESGEPKRTLVAAPE